MSNLSQVHWTARAAFILSLVTSILSVWHSSTHYQRMGRMEAADKSYWVHGQKVTSKYRPLPSAASVIAVSASTRLLAISVLSFLIGFGVYLGLVWKGDLDTAATQGDSRAVFIVYIVVLLLCLGATNGMSVRSLRSLPVYINGWSEVRNLKAGHDEGIEDATVTSTDNRPGSEPTRFLQEPSIHLQHLRAEDRSPTTDPERFLELDLPALFQEAAKVRLNMAAIDQRLAELLNSASKQTWRGNGTETS